MRIIGSFGWYSHYIKNLRVNCKPSYELTHDNTPFPWTNEHEQEYVQIKEDISSDTILTIPECVILSIYTWIHPMSEQAQP